MPSVSSLAPRRLVVVGLGNYTHPLTKHSVGQVLLKSLATHAASLPGSTGSPHLVLSKHGLRTSCWTTKITLPPPIGNEEKGSLEILFVLPKALMNVCGPSILNSISSFLPLPPPSSPSQTGSLKPIPRLLVLADNLDLSPSSTQLQRSGGPKGHNGIRSLIASLGGSREFWRFWIGIGRPEGTIVRGEGVSQWVLGPLGREEVRSCEEGKVLSEAWRAVERIGWEE